jgi:hypothetical protein
MKDQEYQDLMRENEDLNSGHIPCKEKIQDIKHQFKHGHITEQEYNNLLAWELDI